MTMNADAQPKKPRRRIKKVRGHGGHHGGAWKVAYADFVTAMMALFLVLWLVSQADTKVKQAIANYFRSPGVFEYQAGGIVNGPKKISKDPSEMTSKDEEQALFGIQAQLNKKFATRPEFSKYKDQIKIQLDDQGLQIQILDKAERVSFDSGSAALTPGAIAVLGEIAAAICQMPNPILIGGHTDRQTFPEGSGYTNWELSADRANAARRALQANCVKQEQVQRIVGYADTQLLIPDDPYATANRRISITLLRLAPPPGAKAETKAEGESQVVEEPKKKAESHPTPSETKPAEGSASITEKRGPSEVKVGAADTVPANIPRSKEAHKPAAH
jgi:chemotaxis protein MotB